MTQVLLQGRDAESLIAERRARGLDVYDEVRRGVYVVAPAGTRGHGRYQAELLTLLTVGLRESGRTDVVVTGPVNVGHEDDYRVPDVAVVPATTGDDDVYLPLAHLVGEVRSSGDETYQEFDHYRAHGVEEILVVLPGQQRAEIWRAGAAGGGADPDSAYRCAVSSYIGLSETELWSALAA